MEAGSEFTLIVPDGTRNLRGKRLSKCKKLLEALVVSCFIVPLPMMSRIVDGGTSWPHVVHLHMYPISQELHSDRPISKQQQQQNS